MEVTLICKIMKSWGKQYLGTIMKQTATSEMLTDTYSNFLKSNYLVINLIFLATVLITIFYFIFFH